MTRHEKRDHGGRPDNHKAKKRPEFDPSDDDSAPKGSPPPRKSRPDNRRRPPRAHSPALRSGRHHHDNRPRGRPHAHSPAPRSGHHRHDRPRARHGPSSGEIDVNQDINSVLKDISAATASNDHQIGADKRVRYDYLKCNKPADDNKIRDFAAQGKLQKAKDYAGKTAFYRVIEPRVQAGSNPTSVEGIEDSDDSSDDSWQNHSESGSSSSDDDGMPTIREQLARLKALSRK